MTPSTMNSLLIALIGILVIWLVIVSRTKTEDEEFKRFRFTNDVTLPIEPNRDYAAECVDLGGTAVLDNRMKLKRCLWTKSKSI